jgi:diaminopropionate ammonia-lyase
MKLIEYQQNLHVQRSDLSTDVSILEKTTIDAVRNFHKCFPQYKETPLHNLKDLATSYGVDAIYVKDESHRFGLNAFKVLGGAYAIGKYLAEQLDMPIENLSLDYLKSEAVKEKLGTLTFVTATDGNHGRGIAWAARELGHKSVVYMPKGSSQLRLENILAEGAEASITDLNYDDAVRLANQYAEDTGAILIQDSSWPGYEEIPKWIIQGYATLTDEAIEQIERLKFNRPTHVFLQAGVGSFASSVLGYFTALYGAERPISVIVEPNEAACIFKSAQIGDGLPHNVTGFMPTIMAGLACGEPSMVSWDILRDYADMYLSCDDYITELGMQILASPIGSDPKIVSGESGAVGMGVLEILIKDSKYHELAQLLKLNSNSSILIISTEGDTDPINYKKIIEKTL